jgi:hypothetical protein
MVENNQPCDPDDVICQMEVLRHLKGLEEQMGNQAFLERYPGLASAKDQITADVVSQQQKMDAAIDRCGRGDAEDKTVEPAEEAEQTPEE